MLYFEPAAVQAAAGNQAASAVVSRVPGAQNATDELPRVKSSGKSLRSAEVC